MAPVSVSSLFNTSPVPLSPHLSQTALQRGAALQGSPGEQNRLRESPPCHSRNLDRLAVLGFKGEAGFCSQVVTGQKGGEPLLSLPAG